MIPLVCQNLHLVRNHGEVHCPSSSDANPGMITLAHVIFDQRASRHWKIDLALMTQAPNVQGAKVCVQHLILFAYTTLSSPLIMTPHLVCQDEGFTRFTEILVAVVKKWVAGEDWEGRHRFRADTSTSEEPTNSAIMVFVPRMGMQRQGGL